MEWAHTQVTGNGVGVGKGMGQLSHRKASTRLAISVLGSKSLFLYEGKQRGGPGRKNEMEIRGIWEEIMKRVKS